jgi:hypothetical protein
MPYKDENTAREKSRERMRKHREKNVTPRPVTPKDVTPGYIILSDGQRRKVNRDPVSVPDRVFISRCQGGVCSLSRDQFIHSMGACNRSNNWRGNKGKIPDNLTQYFT